jgi:MoaA/NifB/PqqE/SkfB family radical SAM enzyme
MTAPPVEYRDGFFSPEDDRTLPFRWMAKRAVLALPAEELRGNEYASFWIFSCFANYSQRISLTLDGRPVDEFPLMSGWASYSVRLGAPETNGNGPGELVLSLNKVFPAQYHPGDGRELGVRLGPVAFHNDGVKHEDSKFFLDNSILNDREMRSRKIHLASYPTNLGIDIWGRCNIKPHCVYCTWDAMKSLEGDNVECVVDDKTLESYGPFFKSARQLVNCSIGEPLLSPRFPEILDLCQRTGKTVEISTNGQAFTRRTIQALVGNPVRLSVSLDAATKETYAKIRNDNWDEIIPNLILLNEERKKAGNVLKIYMVFIPMKVNRGDLEAYFRLCREIEADSLVLRPLVNIWAPKIEMDRGGYHFNYKDEILRWEEVQEIFRLSDLYAKKYGVFVSNNFDFGLLPKIAVKAPEMNETPAAAAIDDSDDLGFSGLPLCREPWESFYILRRGILPCCHGAHDIAPMANWEAAWNGPQIQEIRDCLRQDKLSSYCLESLGCPIVQRFLREKNMARGDDAIAPPRRSAVVQAINRLLFRIPGKIHHAIRDRRNRRKYS